MQSERFEEDIDEEVDAEAARIVQNFVEMEIREHLNWPADAAVAHLVPLLSTVIPLDSVYSPQNLNNFLAWAKNAPMDELQLVLKLVHKVEHRAEIPIPGPVPLGRRGLSTNAVPMRMCTEPNCRRCNTGRGGYHFRWAGPWLCPATIPANNNVTISELSTAIQNCRCRLCRVRRDS